MCFYYREAQLGFELTSNNLFETFLVPYLSSKFNEQIAWCEEELGYREFIGQQLGFRDWETIGSST